MAAALQPNIGSNLLAGKVSFLQIALTILLLLLAVIDDLRSKKVHNQLVIICFAVAIVFMTFAQGSQAVFPAALSMMTAALIIIPLYLLRIVAGGDVKIFLAVSPLLTWEEILITIFASLIWGSILGLVQVILKGQIKSFLANMMMLFHRSKIPSQNVHKIPYTVALFFGFLSSLVWLKEGA